MNILGSLEYAVKLKDTKLIVVLGHNHCGAVKGAIANAKLGHLTQLVNQIKPAIKLDINKLPLEDETAINSVNITIDEILKQSNTIKSLVNSNKIKIVGAFYDIKSGKVTFL